MDKIQRSFISQFAFVVIAALIPVAMVTFLAIPYILGAIPGEPAQAEVSVMRHMT
jgi:hypothetical protein